MVSSSGAQGVSTAAARGSLLAGRYRVLRRLGTGGMATVLLAEDERLGRRVAVKRLHTGSPEEAADRFHREARLGASLNHPNLVTVYDAQPDGESLLIVMEFVDGASLADQLKHGPLPEGRVIEILSGVAKGLDEVHQRGVVHRDVKPSNILISATGQVKLGDLGIAKTLEDTGITQSGVVLGTLQYIAPEQLAGEPVRPASDVYSLGLIAYEALSGTRVRKGSSLSEVLRQSEQPPPDLRGDRPGTPASAAMLVAGALEREPGRRPGSALGFVHDLAAALRGRDEAAAAAPLPPAAVAPPPPPPEPPAARHRDPRRLAIPGALLLAMVALAALLIVAGNGEDGSSPTAAGGPGKQESRPEGGRAETGSAGGTPATPAEAQTEPPAETAPAPAPAPAAPAPEASGSAVDGAVAAVQDFYELAAAGDYDAATALTTPAFLGAIGGCCEQFDTLESVEFTSAEVTDSGPGSATVAFSDVARHTDHTDTCEGTISLVDAGGWKLDDPSVDCVSS
jgi:eukaryotic-like serine/threonine-protein kinase